MKEQCLFEVRRREPLGGRFSLLVMRPVSGGKLPEGIKPGQFVQIDVHTPGVFLRRPISINRVDYAASELYLLVRNAGKGTETLCNAAQGETFSLILPLGNGFPVAGCQRPLLVGGGVGVAPLLGLGDALNAQGIKPEFLMGARSEDELIEREEFAASGSLHISTDDGSCGFHGLVGDHPVLTEGNYDRIYCCGPLPMMKAVAKVAHCRDIPCFVSLENMMACGVGACLCCVEKTTEGNTCVCTDGPVFNTEQLLWNQE